MAGNFLEDSKFGGIQVFSYSIENFLSKVEGFYGVFKNISQWCFQCAIIS